MKTPASLAGRIVQGVLFLAAGILLVFHFLHLRADFPNHSPWIDWAKYTDEGWYGDAAIRHYLRGTWRLPGDFNPAVALPVWPLLEAFVFRFTGVGIVAARALTVVVFAVGIVCSYFLLSMRAERHDDLQQRHIFAAAATVLLSASSFLFVFTREAILEPLLILMMLLTLLAAYATRSAQSRWHWVLWSVVVGVLVSLMIGTKTTAIFLLPSVFWMLWSSSAWQMRRMVRVTAVTGATIAVLWGVYLAIVTARGYLQDYRYLFTANQYTGITRATFWKVVSDSLKDGMWMGSFVYPLALLMIALTVFHRKIWRDEVFTSLVLWAAGYMVFMAYHANLQPRYYMVVAVPVVLLLMRGALHLAEWHRLWLYGLIPLSLLVVAQETHATLRYALHPEYTYQNAADKIEKIVESEPNHEHTVLSVSGSNLSLMTGLPSICDDFGTMELEDRVAAYKPGWFVAWNYVEDDKAEALNKFYAMTRVAEFPALDDPDRNVMIVYRLDPKDGVKPKRKRPGTRLVPTGGENPTISRPSPVDSK